MSRVGSLSCEKGHLRGGLFFACSTALLAAIAFAACRPTVPPADALPAGLELDSLRIPNPLAIYERLGLIVGEPDFPAVGRFVFLPGPADSSYALFALSLSNRALRFRRAETGFRARYTVRIVVGEDDQAPVDSLETEEEVRVRSFRETARREESIVFQGLLTLPPGDHTATIEIRDPGSTHSLVARRQLSVPAFGPGSITAPIVVYRARPRWSRNEPPSLIVNPRATVVLADPAPRVYREMIAAERTPLVLELAIDDVVTLAMADTVAAVEDTTDQPGAGADSMAAGPRFWAALDSIDPGRLAPGQLTLRVRSPETGAADSSTLVVGLADDWIADDYPGVLDYLRYAGTPAQLDSLRAAAPPERARALQTFWKMRDPDPETAVNEFFAGYFRRIQDANNRFATPSGPGWLTDRGAVYVTLGPPDQVARHLETRQGPGQAQVWLYEEASFGFRLRLVFLDQGAIGEFRLSAESRRAFHEAVLALYSRPDALP